MYELTYQNLLVKLFLLLFFASYFGLFGREYRQIGDTLPVAPIEKMVYQTSATFALLGRL